MAFNYSPKIVTDGLVLCLDAGNIKAYDAAENLVTNSEAFNLWINHINAINISTNSEIAPDGTLSADVISQSAVLNATRYLGSNLNVTYASQTYTISCWVRKVSGTDSGGDLYFQFIGDAGRRSLINATNTWQRFSWTTTLGPAGSARIGFQSTWDINGAANNNVYAIWGFQVELSSTVSDYYPTTTTAKIKGSPWIDLSRGGNNGTLVNGPVFNISSGSRGNISFDGTNDYVLINSGSTNINPTVGITVCSFFNIASYSSNYAPICFKQNNYSGTYEQYSLVLDNTLIGFIVTGIDRQQKIAQSVADYRNQNIYAVGTCDTTTDELKLYINGSLIQTISFTSTFDIADTPINIGGTGVLKFGASYNGWVNGRIHNTQIYNRALSAAEVLQNYNATKTRFGL